jgi:thiamine-phosphate pyrophosphorylase
MKVLRGAPRLMAISDRLTLGSRPFEDWLSNLAEAGVDAVQIREKDLADLEVYRLTRRARTILPSRVAVLVNGRLDVALAAGADGVHLPAAGLPAEPLRRWAEARGDRIVIGRSTHTIDEVTRARREGVDYVTFGPLFPTPSKAPYGPPPGPEGLRRAAAEGVPVVALGGIDADAVPVARAAGAAGVAGIRVFQDPGRLQALVARMAETAGEPAPDGGRC